MNNILSTKTNALFLATIIFAGIIAASIPSSIISTQAEPYGMDRDKESDRNVSVSSLKCNNINVNVNGLELDVLPPFLGSGLEDEAQDGNTDANSFANNGGSNSGSQINDFRFICINNNNNTVIEEQPLEIVTCEECFGANSTLREIVEDALVDQTATVSYIVSLDNNEGDTLTIPGNVDTIEQLCPLLEGHSDVLIDSIISSFLAIDFQTSESGIDALIECLLEAGIIVDRELPPIEICDDGIDNDGDNLVDQADLECLL